MTQLTPRKYTKTLHYLHFAFTMMPTLFGVMAFLLKPDSFFDYAPKDDMLFYIVPVVAIFGIAAGHFLYTRQLKALVKKHSLREKLVGFQSASIIKYATIESPALLGIVGFFLSDNLYFLIIAAILLLYLFFQRPTIDRIKTDLNLDFEEINELNKLDKVLE